MRPTGVVLIALYHFLTAVFLVLLAIALVVGGSMLGAMFGRPAGIPGGGMGIGFLFGFVGATIVMIYATVAGIAGFGLWTMREWGRILSIVLAIITVLFSLPGLMFGLHGHVLFGGFRFFRVAISVAIAWYLLQPQIKALFQRTTAVSPTGV